MGSKLIDEQQSDVFDLRFAIVGAGIGGLASALALAKKGFKDIHVYENASNLGFMGAGIQLAPNLVRILSRLDCWDSVEAEATDVLETSIRDGATDTELALVRMPDIRKQYGYPHCTGHRASLVGGLYQGCRKMPAIKFHFGCAVTAIASFQPKVEFVVKTREGVEQRIIADTLLAADGVKSITRVALLNQINHASEVEDTGQAAYRILLPREKMQGDPEMMALLDSNQVTRWIGEKRHWIAYPIHSRTIYNMSSIQPDTNFALEPSMTYTTKGSKDTMLSVFADFCPLIQRMLDLVPDGQVCEWKLRVQKPLPTWVHGSVALVGDACHPTLPHLNQGAAQAVEDAAVLAEVLVKCPGSDLASLNKSLRVYELIRKERASTLVRWAAESGRILHLGQGKAKEERDRRFADANVGGHHVPDKWASSDVQEYIYSHDCMQEAADQFSRLYQSLS
ncbi:Monooxygenase, FAD-binding protein [Metarhizium guizhouense ARSEF 977]|uniref:Monooxygenase, FAD-binding protein n=1 Tax=Metarhizium guizhouense (strain ARSEF 977) TaxID=1276136 RepID=A0A0B4GW80_METGA|nr:Monooxygenase, FAD-binding protein [Metarhizium guizhouense ARSEF 977]